MAMDSKFSLIPPHLNSNNLFIVCSCFISDTRVQFGLFLGPIFALLLLNAVIFVLVTVVLIKHTRRKLKKNARNHKETVRGTIKTGLSIISVMFMFGLSWAFGALSVESASRVFQWLFVIVNILQGFVFFLFFCVIGSDARDEWKNFFTNLPCIKKKNTRSQASAKGTHRTKNMRTTTRGGSSSSIRHSTVSLASTVSELDSECDTKLLLTPNSFIKNNSSNMTTIEEEAEFIENVNTGVEEEPSENQTVVENDTTEPTSQLQQQIRLRLKHPSEHVVFELNFHYDSVDDSSLDDDETSRDLHFDASQLTQTTQMDLSDLYDVGVSHWSL